MNKEDIKTIFLIIMMLLLISALVMLGVKIYSEFTGSESSNTLEVLYDGYTAMVNNIKDNEPLVENQQNDSLNQVQSADNVNIQTTNDNRYFYNQLNSYAKTIYNKLYENKENLKTGTYKIDFGQDFSALLEQDNGAELLKQYYQSAIETYLYDNPDVFYLDPTKMYINIQTSKYAFKITYQVYIDSGEHSNYLYDEFSSKEQILKAEKEIEDETNQILSQIKSETDYQKILAIHDYLVDNINYDETLSKNNIYNIYGALVNKECVCEGYAKAFKYLINKVGIECVFVIGEAKNSQGNIENHAWNYVKLNNGWYAVDVTWDDPIIRGNGFVGKDIKYKYFLKGSNTMNKDHIESKTFTENGQEYNYPTLKTEDY